MIPVEFNLCNSDQFSQYVRFYNESMKESRFYYDDVRLTSALSRIDANLSITYRAISHCQIQAQFDIEKWIERVNAKSLSVSEQKSDPVIIDPEETQKCESENEFQRDSEVEMESEDSESDSEVVSFADSDEETVSKVSPRQSPKRSSRKSPTGVCRMCTYFHEGDCTRPPIDIQSMIDETRDILNIVEKSDSLEAIALMINLFQYYTDNSKVLSALFRSHSKFLNTVDSKIRDLEKDIRAYLDREDISQEEKAKLKYRYDAAVIKPRQCIEKVRKYLNQGKKGRVV
jgi:hypothetical protein